MVNTDTQCTMELCLTRLLWRCLRTPSTGPTGTHAQWRKATNMTAPVVSSWRTPLTDRSTSTFTILTDSLLVSWVFRLEVWLNFGSQNAHFLRQGVDPTLNNTSTVLPWAETIWHAGGSSSRSKQSLCGEQWRLLSPVPDPPRGAGTHLRVSRSLPDRPNRRSDPVPPHVHQHPVQMCQQWTVC